MSTPRNGSSKISSFGGGTAFLIREPLTPLPTSVPDLSSFESSSVTLQLFFRRYQSQVSIVLRLRPLTLNHYLSSSMTSVHFCPSLQPHPMNLSSPVTLTLISIILQTLSPLRPLSLCLIFSFSHIQQVHFPTHDKNHIVDLVIISSDTSLVQLFHSPIGLHPTTFLSSPDYL